MNPFARLALAGPVAKTFANVLPQSPLLRSGVAAIGMRYALRSMPVALAVLGAGAALKYYLGRDDRAAVKPARTRHASAAKAKPKAKAKPRTKAAAKPE